MYKFESVIHLAAESHVDRSISDPLAFVKTNVIGTMVLLNAFKNLWSQNFTNKLFYHISTDEVYGSLGETGLFTEMTSYDPNSPYSASKAGLIGLTKTLARELAGRNILVNAIAPGAILSPEDKDENYLINLTKQTPLQSVGGVSTLLKSIDYVLDNNHLTGQLLFADGGENLG